MGFRAMSAQPYDDDGTALAFAILARPLVPYLPVGSLADRQSPSRNFASFASHHIVSNYAWNSGTSPCWWSLRNGVCLGTSTRCRQPAGICRA
ncbi:hypothetical protein V8C35DRAFT_306297 [Trichoderma chlorosporum]